MKLSIIIPTLDEADRIGELIRYLKHAVSKKEFEILVSDAGSRDGTRDLAENEGARVIKSERKGRSIQMNRGAVAAKGDIFYFLHADTLPPEYFDRDIRQAVYHGYDAGCFRLAFDNNHPFLSLFSWFTRFDIDIFRFGDQSLFLRKGLFDDIHGFDENLLLMEDQNIIKKIRKAGGRFTLLSKSVTTSARKYKNNGVLRLQFLFVLIWGLYYCGAGQDVLFHFYKSMIQK